LNGDSTDTAGGGSFPRGLDAPMMRRAPRGENRHNSWTTITRITRITRIVPRAGRAPYWPTEAVSA